MSASVRQLHQALVHDYLKGQETVSELYAKHNVTSYALYKALRDAGIVITRRRIVGRRTKSLSPHKDRILCDYRAGKSMASISIALGIDKSAIRCALKYWGEPIRDPSQAARQRYRRAEEREKTSVATKAVWKKYRKKMVQALRNSVTPERLARVSCALKGKYMGSLASNWRGGISFLPYPEVFNTKLKDAIREWDGRRCQGCNKTAAEATRDGRRLSIHHIDYNKFNMSLRNLVTTCASCNSKARPSRPEHREHYEKITSRRSLFMIPLNLWTSDTIRDLGVAPQWHYLLEHFEAFDYRRPKNPHLLDMRRRDNIVGHYQRCVNIWWAFEQCFKTGDIGIEFGSAGVQTPWCLSTDVRTGLPSHYPPEKPIAEREIVKGHVRVDCWQRDPIAMRHDILCGDDEVVFGTNAFTTGSFALVVANHVLEHAPGDPVAILAEWARLLRPGGKIVVVLPDQRWVDVLKIDPDHKHAWTGEEFLEIAKRVPGCEVIEHTAEKQINHFSFLTVWVKR